VQSNGHKLLAVGGVSDHIHIFLGYNLNQKIPDLVNNIKTSTSHWINRERLSRNKFNWQNGYGAFTHSYSNIDRVIKYILNQEEHHNKISFKEEYIAFLKKHDLEFKAKYLFDFFDD
jgi:REP element-mobilizing transposase RayT